MRDTVRRACVARMYANVHAAFAMRRALPFPSAPVRGRHRFVCSIRVAREVSIVTRTAIYGDVREVARVVANAFHTPRGGILSRVHRAVEYLDLIAQFEKRLRRKADSPHIILLAVREDNGEQTDAVRAWPSDCFL